MRATTCTPRRPGTAWSSTFDAAEIGADRDPVVDVLGLLVSFGFVHANDTDGSRAWLCRPSKVPRRCGGCCGSFATWRLPMAPKSNG
jgi:hypothetical protein